MPWPKGRSMSPEQREKIAAAKRGTRLTPEHRMRIAVGVAKARSAGADSGGNTPGPCPEWDGVIGSSAYRRLHSWRLRNRPKVGVCEKCGAERRTQWSNVSGEYRGEDDSDWRELCVPCHVVYDRARKAAAA